MLNKLALSTQNRIKNEKNNHSLEEVKKDALSMPKGYFEFENALKSDNISFICEVK